VTWDQPLDYVACFECGGNLRNCGHGAVMAPVPNKPKTPVTGFRIPEDVKAAAVTRAEAEGKTLTDVVVDHLRRYGKGKPKL
jgi:hypothetical protein